MTLRLALAGLALLFGNGCNSCPFGIIQRIRVEGTIECCGAQAYKDVAVPAVDALEIDIANASGEGSNRVDAFVVSTDCQRLFTGQYPSAQPLCPVLVGPVSRGAVSSRIRVSAGTYRVVLQTWSNNGAATTYDVDIGVWGKSCRISPTSVGL